MNCFLKVSNLGKLLYAKSKLLRAYDRKKFKYKYDIWKDLLMRFFSVSFIKSRILTENLSPNNEVANRY